MSRYDHERDQLADFLPGEPAYRVNQLFDGLYHHFAEPEAITGLPRSLRERLAAAPELTPALAVVRESVTDDGETVKWLFSLPDGNVIESVLMLYRSRATVCVSSQAGCAMACTFCATGDGGYFRHLSVGEILEQVVVAARAAAERGRRLDHVVFMGMGEPLANFPRVWRASERIVTDLGIGARRITISTVGIAPQIRALGDKALQVNLAVSLHAANDALRDRLVPINKRYPIEVLVGEIERYVERTGRRVSFEWAVIDGVNDRPSDAEELAVLARRIRGHVNLIPMNPTDGGSARGLRGSPPARVQAFRDELVRREVNVTVRRTRGREIDAACGQLAGSVTLAPPTTRGRTETPRPTRT
jgi:23S rRNA (adenine2503-C2)-methyltransferase